MTSVLQSPEGPKGPKESLSLGKDPLLWAFEIFGVIFRTSDYFFDAASHGTPLMITTM